MRQPFNLTQAATIAQDLISDAKNFSARVKDEGHIEELEVRHFVAKFTALNVNLNQAIQLSDAAGNARAKRNIFGSILSSLTGLVTEEELQKEKMEEKQLEAKVKSIITHETHMQTELSRLEEEVKKIYYDDFKEIRKLQFAVMHNMRYLSRKSWRMRILQEYMEKMRIAIELAFGGEIGMSESADVMADAQIKGSSRVKFLTIEHDADHFFVKMYFDVGTFTTVDKSCKNDSTCLLQTTSRLYLVSEHFLDGTPISMAEVRVIRALSENCLTLVHLTLYSYKTIVSGNLTCYIFGKGKILYQLNRGDMLHIESRDFCRNECIEVGYKGYNNKKKNLPTQPTVQPAALQHFLTDVDLDNVPSPMLAMEKAHQVAHDMLNNDIRENEDLLEQLNAPQLDEPISTVGKYVGFVGAALSLVIVIVALILCFKCRKGNSNNHRSQKFELKRFKELATRERQEEEEEEM